MSEKPLRQAAAEKVQATWTKVGTTAKTRVSNWVSLRTLGGTLPDSELVQTDNGNYIEAGRPDVSEQEANPDTEERLVRALGFLAAKYECSGIRSGISSVRSLRVFERVFGAKRLSIELPPHAKVRILPYEDGIASVRVYEEMAPITAGLGQFGLIVDANTRELDTTDWLEPIEDSPAPQSR